MRRYYEPYTALDREHGVGFVLESPTWRASRAGRRARYNERSRQLNRKAIA